MFPQAHIGVSFGKCDWREAQKKVQGTFVSRTKMALRVKRRSEYAVLPTRADPGSAGYDLHSAACGSIAPGSNGLVPTDLSIQVPPGTYGRIAPRSGLAWKHKIHVGGGVIDASYRGAVGIVLFNHDSEREFKYERGDRVAQLILEQIVTPDVQEVGELDVTGRGEGGFGSTGVSQSAANQAANHQVDTIDQRLTPNVPKQTIMAARRVK